MKLFVLGCSFTKYHWPSWVDIIRHSNPEIEILNFARPGIGNVRIFYRLNELLIKNLIGNDDLILIVWTSWHREDRLLNQKWVEEGNIFNSKEFGKKFVSKYWSSDFDIIKNCNAIIASNKIANIQLNGSWLDLNKTESYLGDQIYPNTSYNNLYSKYEFYKNSMPEFIKFDHSKNSFFNNKSDDRHPDIQCHYDYAKKVTSHLNLKLDSEDYWKKQQDIIESNINLKMKKETLWNTISKVIHFKQDFEDPIKLES